MQTTRTTRSKVLILGIILAVLGIVPIGAAPPPAPVIDIEQLAGSCTGELTPIWVSWNHIPTADFYKFKLIVNGMTTVSGSGGALGFGSSVITPSEVTVIVEACKNPDECSQSFKTISITSGSMPR